jgi:hypothetical protein
MNSYFDIDHNAGGTLRNSDNGRHRNNDRKSRKPCVVITIVLLLIAVSVA